jgi:hypothetical protein
MVMAVLLIFFTNSNRILSHAIRWLSPTQFIENEIEPAKNDARNNSNA